MSGLFKELQTQNITDYEFWDGIYLPSIKASINAAHKQIVEYAMVAGWDEVAIAEDDLKMTHHKSWKYFLSQKPTDFDLYLGGIFLGEPDENGVVSDFTGLSCYIVSRRFFNTFLSTNPDEHLDRALCGLGKYIVCRPFICTQYDGFSSNTGKIESYEYLQRNRIFYNG